MSLHERVVLLQTCRTVLVSVLSKNDMFRELHFFWYYNILQVLIKLRLGFVDRNHPQTEIGHKLLENWTWVRDNVI